MSDPPFEVGATHDTVAAPSRAIAVTPFGAPGAVGMTNPDDAPDHCEVPWALVAFALQVYVAPGVRLTISTDVSVDVPVRVMPPVFDEHDTV